MSPKRSETPNPAPALIMGLPVCRHTHEQVLERMTEIISRRDPGHFISITNTETMYQGLRADWLGRYIREADFSLCDGVGVVVAGWAWGHRIERFTEPHLQLAASDHGRAHGWRHFFYGGKPGVPEEMARRLGERYPGLVVCGTYSPPFQALSPEEDERIVAMINETRPDIVWVGLSLPKQERWIQEHLHRVQAPWMVGVGAAFDYHSGAVPWAPPLARRLGAEWIYRLLREPKLRGPRYWRSFKFVLESAWGGLRTLRFLARPRSSG